MYGREAVENTVDCATLAPKVLFIDSQSVIEVTKERNQPRWFDWVP